MIVISVGILGIAFLFGGGTEVFRRVWHVPGLVIVGACLALGIYGTYLVARERQCSAQLKEGWNHLVEEREGLEKFRRAQEEELRVEMRRGEQEVQNIRTKAEREIALAKKKHEEEAGELRRICEQEQEALRVLAQEKTRGFPWLARAFSDYSEMLVRREASFLENKTHPAMKAAEMVRAIATQRRVVEEKLRIANGIIEFWKQCFPFLEDFLEDIDDDLLQKILDRDVTKPIRELGEVLDIDPVRFYVPKEEYDRLSPAERNQLALDKWRARRKSKWEIGRCYERYIGFLHEQKGYSVYYQGILEGYDDLGRDLVAKFMGETLVIQCKYWSQFRQVRENHVNQLFGTLTKYQLEHRDEQATGVLYVGSELSPRARDFAEHLGIVVHEKSPYDENYPCIKCNVSRATGERIYHLPFDQQYDRTIIEGARGERYVSTVAEAERLGFRRAWRWHGEAQDVVG